MVDHLAPPPGSESSPGSQPQRDPYARLQEHWGPCARCGVPVKIPKGQPHSPCLKCGGKGVAYRTRETQPPYRNDTARRTLFRCPVNPLPFRWIGWITISNLYRYAARRSLDSFSLALAIVTIAIPIAFGPWPGFRSLLARSPLYSGLFLALSVAWGGCILIMLTNWTTRGQWGEVPLEECVVRRARIGSVLPLLSARRGGRRRQTRRGSYRRRLRQYFRGVRRIHLAASLSRSPRFRTVPYLLSLAVVAAAAGWFYRGHAELWLVTVLGTLDISLAVLTAFYLLCRTAYDRVPPDEYASLVLGGRRAEAMFRWIAWEMYCLCSTFLDSNTVELKAAHDELSAELRRVRGDPEDPLTTPHSNTELVNRLGESMKHRDRVRLKLDIDQLESRLLDLRMNIRRCAAMKTLAANEFGIHHRRLCDHVFRFSPTIFERRVSKYIRNWRTISRAIPRSGRAQVPWWRVVDLVDENDRIVKRIRRRANYLRLIVGSTGFFEDVRVFASTTSLRDSLTAYANAMTHFAEMPAKGRHALQNAQLATVYLMQQAHPGIDLHRALLQLCRGGVPWCEARATELAERAEVLDDLAEKDGDPKSKWRDYSAQAKRKQSDLETAAGMWRRCTNVLATIEANAGHSFSLGCPLGVLRDLATLVSVATHNTQWEINRMVESELLRWLRDRPNVLIMTYGNSRVVRDVLKCVAMPLLGKQSNEKHHDTIFIARTEADEFESRMMAFSLREDRRWYKPGTTAELGYGNDTLLSALIEELKANDVSVMVLLGAESFDPDGRIVQIASAYRQIANLKHKLKSFNTEGDPERVLFVAVAESYKLCANLSRDTGFYRDHLDQVALYPKGIIDLIISNNQRYPVN